MAWTKLPEDTGIYVGSLDSNETKFLVNTSRFSLVAYSPPGYLLFVRDDTLMAQRLDLAQLAVSGEPFPIARKMGYLSSFSVSENGVLTYQSADLNSRLVWRDRSGELLGTVGEPGGYIQLALSPDQERVAVARKEGASAGNIWLLELSTGILSRFTSDSTDNALTPVWSPDGRRLAFQSGRRGTASLFQKSVGGSEEELLFESGDFNYPKDWSSNSDIIFISLKAERNSLHALRLDKASKGKSRLLLEDCTGKDDFQLSPNERWISYHSNESGALEVYTAAFPNFSSRRQVSIAGGAQARWRGDGKELFFLQPDGKLMSVEVKEDAVLETGIPKVLFQTPVKGLGNHRYGVTSDGQKFLFIERVQGNSEPIHVVQNWFEELKRMVPTDN